MCRQSMRPNQSSQPYNMQTFELTETTRVASMRGEAESALVSGQAVLLRGYGNATTKVVSLAELLKRQLPHLRQITALLCEEAGLEITLSSQSSDSVGQLNDA